MEGSLARSYVPGGDEFLVRPGNDPCCHVFPLNVAQPGSVLPPPTWRRPCCTPATIVPLYEKMSGSTCVWCWSPSTFPLNGSELICVINDLADADPPAAANTNDAINAIAMSRRVFTNLSFRPVGADGALQTFCAP